ncbi:MAG: HNH endonuclease family protein [Nitrosomonas sp.]|uniref:HNH endonuclease family protein n=1 Tax=Nitrosomonas sp. TaxID=42353 RepID=UPI001DEFAC1B|nr:HNH endonuclease family protein [Nitrosomonas sp.]MBX9894555.1 HNH endonuclease family protein [Nitrosomonas sp.]
MPNIVLSLLTSILVVISGCAVEKRVTPQQESIAAPAPVSPYNRKDWPHWIDADGDCQNTRQEMLIATSRVPVKFKDARHCIVVSGEWFGVYTGKTFTKASNVDIDHIVPLAHAHRHGADKWTRDQRRMFANDFENLLVVDDSVNQSKSDQAPHEWLPPRKEYWCEYGKRWQRIKEKYQLWYAALEVKTLRLLAETCQ